MGQMLKRFSLFLNLILVISLRGFSQGNLAIDARVLRDDDTHIYLWGEEINYKYDMQAGSIYIQLLNQSPQGERDDFRLGEAWFILNFYDEKVFVKVGRIPLPFGLNAIYDPHFEVIQPLYQQSLGLRLDEGACVSGSYGSFKYFLSASRGLRKERKEGKTTYILRVEREIPPNPFIKGDFGFSLLSGDLPLVTEEGLTNKYIDKTRIGLDFKVPIGRSLLLGEAHIGGDKDINVGGFFLLFETPWKERTKFILSWRSFNFDLDKKKEVSMGGGGLSWEIDAHNRLSLIYQRDLYNKKDIYTLQWLIKYNFNDIAKLRF